MSKIVKKRLEELLGNPAINEETKTAAKLVLNVFAPSDDDEKDDPPGKTYEEGLVEGRAESLEKMTGFGNWAMGEAKDWADSFDDKQAKKVFTQFANDIEKRLPKIDQG